MSESKQSNSKPLKLIYVVGFARSGTTILGNLLGELEGFIHVGELCRLWRRTALSQDRCGCGQNMESCTLWSDAIGAWPSHNHADSQATHVNFSENVRRAWETQRRAEASTGWKDLLQPSRDNSSLKAYARLMEDVLHGVASKANARVIVDTSKLPRAAAYLSHLETVTPYFLHMIRDSRGAVFARQRRVARREGKKFYLNRVTTAADSYRWFRGNLFAGYMGKNGKAGRYLSVRYESLIAQPAATLRAISSWVGENSDRLPVDHERTATLGPNHTVSGNRNRHATGKVALTLDERWKDSLRTRDFLLITALTWPILSAYGYPLKRDNTLQGDR